MMEVMTVLRQQAKIENAKDDAIDMVLANYVYEKVYAGVQKSMGYTNVFPTNKVFG